MNDDGFDDESAIDINRLPAQDREAIMARVAPDTSVPSDAYCLSQSDLRRELLDRSIQPKGFYNDDAARLQEEFNREFTAERQLRLEQNIRTAAVIYLKETISRRRMEKENELREEVEEIASHPDLEISLDLLKRNTQLQFLIVRLSSIGARVLCKTLVYNHTLQSLNLNRNALNDMAGKQIAQMLRRNGTLLRLELESNCFGPATARNLADALCCNETLVFLSLESNPLAENEQDHSGIEALGAMLAKNTSLLTLNLWRTRIELDGGKYLANGIEKNDTMVCLDIGNNRISNADAMRISTQLELNQKVYHEMQTKARAIRMVQVQAAQVERTRQEELKKAAQHEEWLERRRIDRQEKCDRLEEERRGRLKEEEDRLRQISERKALEFIVRLELEKKKKKKKGSKKKK